MRVDRRLSFLSGLVFGAVSVWAAHELLYVNWWRAVPPVDSRPLMIREDAKGDGRFGAPRSGRRMHRGIDFAAPLGSPVRAIRSGLVVANTTHRGMGRYLEVQHRGGLSSLYAHLNSTTVAVGQRVRQGQRIGAVGKTGNARHALITPHLHLEISQKGALVDPATIFAVIEPPPSHSKYVDAHRD